ncbi:MAG: CRISPR-associated endonuclease Cas2 [Patescibacteria group bacterium]
MKGDFTRKILEALGDAALGTSALFEAILSSGYGAPYGKIRFEADKIRRIQNKNAAQRNIENKIKRRYYSLLHKLKRDGLIRLPNDEGKLIITKKGKLKLAALKQRVDNALPSANYQITKSDKVIVVSFDIPEKLRTKRGWLREALKNMGLKMVQQSVWIGKTKISPEFLKDASNLKILEFIEIFEISKSGSLKQID